MAEPSASLAFLPWLRRGISASARSGATTGGRVTVPVEIAFSPSRHASINLDLYGPAEVVGIDPRMVIRTWPSPNVYDAEPNLFPVVEFDQADFPWRYTPAFPVNDRLQPWLCLIVLKDEEISSVTSAGPTRPLPSIMLSSEAVLPLLGQAWAWAHAQVTGVQTINKVQAAELLENEPHRLISRLLCPRKLESKKRYTAFLVPTYEVGRRAGLGLTQDQVSNPLQPAWSSETENLQLPVYFQWKFGCAEEGDFEELVKRLKPKQLPSTIGLRLMDVSDPGAKLPSAAPMPLGLEGALKATDMQSTEWPIKFQDRFAGAITTFLNLPSKLLTGAVKEIAVAPPLYGRWHAGQDQLTTEKLPRWFHEVNVDPRLRAAAGLGTKVIQTNQRQLLAAAWQQVKGIREINDRLRFTQLAREVSTRIFQRHVATGDDEFLMQLSAPLHGRIRSDVTTVATALAGSSIAEGTVGPGWRRVSRPLGSIGRRQARLPGERSQILKRMNLESAKGRISPAYLPRTAVKLATPTNVSRRLIPNWQALPDADRAKALAQKLGTSTAPAGAAASLLFRIAGSEKLAATSVTVTTTGVAPIVAAPSIGAAPAIDPAIFGKLITNQSKRHTFVARESSPDGIDKPVTGMTSTQGKDSPSALNFRKATASLLQHLELGMLAETPPKVLAFASLRRTLEDAIDPRKSIGADISKNLQFAASVSWNPADALQPLLLGPEFPQPMSEALIELSKDWLLPGLDQVPANSVTLVKTNQRFIEAFMLGLNHEMGRELLWHEYPTDQRRTFFRAFWDRHGSGSAASQNGSDIRPIRQWLQTAQLGENTNHKPGESEQLVLMIRGDLLQRYPNVIVYATRATRILGRKPVLGDEERYPVFSGRVDPDIAFFGFNLTEAEARGDRNSIGRGNPGWFFVIQEQFSEPRFGLDTGTPGSAPTTTWRDLNWGHLLPKDGKEENIGYIDLDSNLPDTRGIVSPATVTWHASRGLGRTGSQSSDLAYVTFQATVRVVVHAAELLPPKETK